NLNSWIIAPLPRSGLVHGWLTDRVVDVNDDTLLKAQVTSRLYPNGFSGGHFIDVILRQTVWATSFEHG
ncbi:hypothetical protein, partial [Candidatus Nitrotoga sp. BS]|uniref:hypothetical protein n=1 Tax=Candidatus Nitrotoga sp. BS TaxID=2890408 RepID=UPI001EF24FF8